MRLSLVLPLGFWSTTAVNALQRVNMGCLIFPYPIHIFHSLTVFFEKITIQIDIFVHIFVGDFKYFRVIEKESQQSNEVILTCSESRQKFLT